MNCSSARRFLYAFADGELSVKDNCEVLDHLKMCRDCARIVADQQALRGALRRAMTSEPVPAGLQGRVQTTASLTTSPSVDSHVAAPPVRWRRFALAAGLLLAAATGAYFTLPARHTPISPVTPVILSSSIADKAVRVHLACARHSPDEHQAKDWPRQLVTLHDAVTKEYAGRFDVLAPDLSDAGYEFESANRCDIDSGSNGVHIIYRNGAKNARVSLFAVPRCTLCSCGTQAQQREPMFCETRTAGGVTFQVCGWQCPRGRTSFVVCGPVSHDDLQTLVAQRFAAALEIPPAAPVMAMTLGSR